MAPHVPIDRSIALIGAEGDRSFEEIRNAEGIGCYER